ncbi:MAG: MmgE/PrpD family protein [Chloroflexi bacterium]|nr:MmgE/PrpD family protein [Chloroflexota bacterium]
MRGKYRLDPADVLGVEVRVQPRSIELSGIRDPRDGIQTKFSIYFATSAALVYGRATLRQFDNSYVDDPEIRALMDRTTLIPDTSMDWYRSELRIKTRGGRILVQPVNLRELWSDRRRAESQLSEKFRDLAGMILPADRVSRLGWLTGRLEDVEDLRELTREWAQPPGQA